MRRLLGTIAVASFLGLSSCVFLPTSNPVSTYKDIRETIRSAGGNLDLPDVTITLNAAGDDAIDVYTEGTEDKRIYIAEAVGDRLGEEYSFAIPDYLDENVASVQLDRRLLQPRGDSWSFAFDTAAIQQAVAYGGYDSFNLIVCHPAVATEISATRPPDFDACFNGAGWVVDATAINISVEARPEVTHYLGFVAGVFLGVVLLGALAWVIGTRLRTGPFRRRTPGAVALGLIAGGIVIVGVASTIGFASADLGPSDNLALAEDLRVGLYALSAGAPALIGGIPGLIFMVLLVKKRPWPDEPAAEARPWPAPPPPTGPPSAPPPPPISWGSR